VVLLFAYFNDARSYEHKTSNCICLSSHVLPLWQSLADVLMAHHFKTINIIFRIVLISVTSLFRQCLKKFSWKRF